MGLMGEDLRDTAPEILHRAHIESRLVYTQTHTRSCITVLDRASGTVTELVEEAPAIEPVEAAALLALVREVIETNTATAVLLSGSLPHGCPEDLYRKAVEICTERGLPCVLDAAGRALLAALPAKPAVVKINVHELQEAFALAENETVPDAVRRLSRTTEGLAVVTDGPGPVLFSRNGGECHALHPPVIETVNPIGSGDAVSAGIALGLAQGYADDEAVRLGIAMGTANALTLRPGEFSAEDVDRLRVLVG